MVVRERTFSATDHTTQLLLLADSLRSRLAQEPICGAMATALQLLESCGAARRLMFGNQVATLVAPAFTSVGGAMGRAGAVPALGVTQARTHVHPLSLFHSTCKLSSSEVCRPKGSTPRTRWTLPIEFLSWTDAPQFRGGVSI